MAKVTQAFLGVPDGDIYPKQFEPGDEVHGDLAVIALGEGWAEEGEQGTADGGSAEGDSEKGAKPAENKARKAAPENKGA